MSINFPPSQNKSLKCFPNWYNLDFWEYFLRTSLGFGPKPHIFKEISPTELNYFLQIVDIFKYLTSISIQIRLIF